MSYPEARRLERPDWDTYYLNIAAAAALRSNCIRRQVGALIVSHKAIISTGYNGTPIGVTNCSEGGCPRCQSGVGTGEAYDTCLCVHAEQNAIALAARHGNKVEGGTMYTTLRPCFGCLKECIQAGLREIVYGATALYPDDLESIYQRLVEEARIGFRQHEAKLKVSVENNASS